ncbi:MAG: exonuclease SbcCD subunit D [Candidatus Babeliales bacterium]
MAITFIHTADIHFGMENYGRLDPKTGIHTRLLDFKRALDACIDHAIEQQVDFFLFAGDAYKTAHPSPTQQRLLFQCLLRLFKADIPVILVIGNHDNPLSFGKAHALDIFDELPITGFHVIAKPTVLNLKTKHGPVNIVGIPWPSRTNIAIDDTYKHASSTELTQHISKQVSGLIAHYARELDQNIPAVLAGHLTVSNGIFSGSEKRAIYGTDPLFMPSQLAIAPFDYVALGHLHRYQNLNPNGYPAIVYAGSIERVDFGERKEDKGFCLVTIHEKNSTTHEFIKGPMRPFLQITCKLALEGDQTEQVIKAISEHDITDAVVKIVYHVPIERRDMVDLQAVQRACEKALYVVGIIPVMQFKVRERRPAIKVDMDLKTLLATYFKDKPELCERSSELIEKALMLQQEIQQEEIEG